MRTKKQIGHAFFLFPLWWLFASVWLVASTWSLVHVVNFPSVVPAILVARLKNLPIIYDIEDTYIDQLHAHHVCLRNLGLMMEKLSLPLVDAVVLVDEMQIAEFGGIPNRNIVVVYDSPFPILGAHENFFEGNDFKIFYAGALNKRRHLNLESLIESIVNVEGVKVIFAGEGNLVPEITSYAQNLPNKIIYLGWVPYDKMLQMSLEADLLFSLRDPDPPVQKYICGSKFLEAIMCGKPFLVNKGTSAAIKVAKCKCGFVVDSHNVEDVRAAILKLIKSEELRNQLGANGQRACNQIYGWEIMKRRLLRLYHEALQNYFG